MAHFWFHVRHAEGRLLDEEGMDLPNLRAACEEVRRSSQELLTEDLNLTDVRFEVADVTGRIVACLPVTMPNMLISTTGAPSARSSSNLGERG